MNTPPPNKLDIKTGDIINGITFLEEVPSDLNHRKAKFKCHCGTEFITNISSVNTGRTKSCGCTKLVKDKIHNFNKGDIIDATTDENKTIKVKIGATSDVRPFGLKGVDMECLIISDEMFDANLKSKPLAIYYKSNDANKLQDDLDDFLKGEDYNVNNVDENVKIMSMWPDYDF